MFRRIARSFAAQFLSMLVSLADRLFLIGILVRSWGTVIYADWTMLIATAALLSLGEFGLNVYFGNAWQAAHARRNEEEFGRLSSIAAWLYAVLVSMLALVATIYVLAIKPAQTLGLRALADDTARVALGLLAITATLRVARGFSMQIYRGRGDFAVSAIVDAFVGVTAICAVVPAVLLGADVVIVAALYLAAEIGVGWFYALRDIGQRYPELTFAIRRPTRAELKDVIAHLRWFAILQGAGPLWLNLPVLMLGKFATSSNAIVTFVLMRTLVNFARQFATMLSLATGVETAVLPGPTDERARYLSTIGAFGSVLSASLLSGLFVFLAPLLRLWTGHAELADPKVALLLYVGVLAAAPALPLSSVAMFGGNARAVAITSVAQLAIGLTIGWTVQNQFGLAGLAAGLSVGEFFAQLVVLPRYADPGLDWWKYVVECFGRAAAAGVWCALVGAFVVTTIGTDSLFRLAYTIAAWSILGAAPAIVLAGLDRNMRNRLYSALRRATAQ